MAKGKVSASLAASAVASTSAALTGALVQMQPGRFRMNVHVKPGARSTTIAPPMPTSMLDGPLEMRIAAQPEGGKANKELVEYLEELFSRAAAAVESGGGGGRRPPNVDVRVTHGATNRTKVIEVVTTPPDGTITADMLWAALVHDCEHQ
jgi:uncharacterized protein YggU (UPF0235/DUF167 family)